MISRRHLLAGLAVSVPKLGFASVAARPGKLFVLIIMRGWSGGGGAAG